MDQNSTNGTGADKRNWRERLGIGAKEMPKLSEEFKSPPPLQPPPAGAARPAPRAPQPVTKPAPMAPRATPKAAAEPAQQAAAQPQRGPDPAAQDALAQKLRAQRAAAEKLAEQRVQAARERAEAKSAAPEPALSMPPRQPGRTVAPSAPPPPAARTVPPAAAPAARPKFSFAEDEGAAPRREARPAADATQPPRPALGAPPPLVPPRPALGGERSQPPFLRPNSLGGGRTQPPAYRPIDPATGYTPPPRPAAVQPPAPRNYGAEQPGAGPGFTSTRAPVRRPPALDPYARSGEPRGYAGDDFEEDPRSGPRLSRPPALSGRGRPRPADEDHEEVFEDDPAPRQRASARDYQNAYREQDGGFEEEQRRSSGPWLLLLALLVAALVTGGVVWFYNTKMKNAATSGTTTSDQVPVVEAPADPAKTAPEQPADAQGEAPAVKKKQIYDRIVGDQEVTGDQVLPTEEIPVQPAAAEPATGVNQIPAPDVPPAEGTIVDEPAPLPLPPPPGNDQQGSLDQTGIERIAAAATQPEQGSTAPPVLKPTAGTTTSTAELPPPEPTSAGAEIASPAPAPEPEPEVIIKPVKKKEAAPKEVAAPAKKKAVAAVAEEQDFGAEPVVLVPPAQPIAPPSQTEPEVAVNAPISQQGGTEAAPVRKKKTIFDLFRGSDEASAPAEETQVAAVQPKATAPAKPAPAPAPVEEPAPQQASTGGSGYVVQLASFRSQAEAQSEYGRLSSLYPTVVGGLPQRVAQSKVGGSTRYQLGLGPIKNRSEATRVCSALFQAGERDCIVRSQ